MSSQADQFRAELGEGSLTDLEYARLVAKTGTTFGVYSMMDLYALAGESPRLPLGKYSSVGPPATGPGLVPTGLVEWFRAQTLDAQADVSDVTAWTDDSGNGRNAVGPGTNPYLYKNFQNGLSVVGFNGTNDYLNVPADSAATPVVTFVLATALVSSNANNSYVGADANGGLQFRNNAGTLQLVKQAVGVIGGSTTTVDTLFHIVAATYDSVSGAFAFYKDNTAIGSGTNALAPVASNIRIGGSTGQFLSGYIGEFAKWNRVLNGTELSDVMLSLKSKWATP